MTMQQAIQIQTVINEAMVKDAPGLLPLLGHRVQMIAIDLEPEAPAKARPKITLEQFLATRLKRPKGVAPVTLEDMEKAIVRGAVDGNL
ncbi:MAG: hypothetical protein WBH99_03815 [Azovibrio sp.]|uniref:hypothetical protein n=1 Tax=Azovibrio sp. TaxID=1872673 RepID=UPI003C758A0A